MVVHHRTLGSSGQAAHCMQLMDGEDHTHTDNVSDCAENVPARI